MIYNHRIRISMPRGEYRRLIRRLSLRLRVIAERKASRRISKQTLRSNYFALANNIVESYFCDNVRDATVCCEAGALSRVSLEIEDGDPQVELWSDSPDGVEVLRRLRRLLRACTVDELVDYSFGCWAREIAHVSSVHKDIVYDEYKLYKTLYKTRGEKR